MLVAWKPPELCALSNKGGERRPNDKIDPRLDGWRKDAGRNRGEPPTFWCDTCEDWYDFHYVLYRYRLLPLAPTILECPRCLAKERFGDMEPTAGEARAKQIIDGRTKARKPERKEKWDAFAEELGTADYLTVKAEFDSRNPPKPTSLSAMRAAKAATAGSTGHARPQQAKAGDTESRSAWLDRKEAWLAKVETQQWQAGAYQTSAYWQLQAKQSADTVAWKTQQEIIDQQAKTLKAKDAELETHRRGLLSLESKLFEAERAKNAEASLGAGQDAEEEKDTEESEEDDSEFERRMARWSMRKRQSSRANAAPAKVAKGNPSASAPQSPRQNESSQARPKRRASAKAAKVAPKLQEPRGPANPGGPRRPATPPLAASGSGGQSRAERADLVTDLVTDAL
jgi:hypothetical protein